MAAYTLFLLVFLFCRLSVVRVVFCWAGGVGEDGGVEGPGGAGNWGVGRARSSPRGHLPEGQRGADQQQAQSGREDSPAGAAGEYPTAGTLSCVFVFALAPGCGALSGTP